MFFLIKKRQIIAIAFCFISITIVLLIIVKTVSADKYIQRYDYTVVIDAGHGGIDGGVIGSVTGKHEASLNLGVAKKLETYFKEFGIKTVMTRKNADGLYGLTHKNFKKKDMQERAKIIKEANPDAVISIHMNFFSQAKQRGAQVFYKENNLEGEELARCIQQMLGNNIEYCNRLYLKGDYYIVNCNDFPSVIVECGFLSNAEDEALLLTDEYQQKLAYNIMLGCLKFFNISPYEISASA